MTCEHKLELCMICLNKLRDKIAAVEKQNADIQVQLFRYLNLKDLYRAMLTPGKPAMYSISEAWDRYEYIIKGGFNESCTKPQ